ncbi:polyamine ABC transporter substrate-binding protein [Leeia aquatica]|uniref:Putrescine-binding periplasmic protein n=1 Tax=Leeia aquatica TaxID=2725557 RepID=A0A847RY31_9NEIS|nr:polyamine ABC transporter substrate-binding protein [Leeia aquatica]NLR74631.1 polyamine ABC transporter substrate-binding protein [Leeia aquatica]
MQYTLSRALTGLGLLLALSAQAAEEKKLNVYNWNDYVAKNTIVDFEKATGYKLKYDLYDANETLQAKLFTGNSGYDVVYPSVEFAGKQIQAGIYRQLDKSKLPNLKNIDPLILKAMEKADPGNQYLIPYMWGTTAVAINTDKVMKALGGKLPDNAWDLVFNPEVTSKLKGCGISYMDSPSDLVPMALIDLGRDANKFDDESVNAAVAMLSKVRKNVRTFNSSPIDQMAKGSLCVAIMFSGDAYQAKKRAEESKTGAKVQYLIPKKGTVMWIDTMALPKDGKHPEGANLWLNSMMDPKVIAQISGETFYLSANKAALALTDKALMSDPALNIPDDVKAKLVAKQVIPKEDQRRLTLGFNRFKTAK